jgi:hypothetical protein
VLSDMVDEGANDIHVKDAEPIRLLVEVVAKLRSNEGEHHHRLRGRGRLKDGGQRPSVADSTLDLQPDFLVRKLK